jgi:hypothetical protein
MPGPMVESRPPRLANVLTRSPLTSPSLFAATSTYVMWSRPWIVEP